MTGDDFYAAIVRHWCVFGVPPTTQWLARTLSRSQSVVHHHQRRLERRGLLVRVGHRWVPSEIKRYLAQFTPAPLGAGVTPKI